MVDETFELWFLFLSPGASQNFARSLRVQTRLAQTQMERKQSHTSDSIQRNLQKRRGRNENPMQSFVN